MHVRRLLGLVLLGAACVALLAHYPEFRKLLGPRSRQEDPLAFLRNLPEPRMPVPQPVRPRPRNLPPAVPAAELSPVQEQEGAAGENQVPNEEVARVLLRILSARKLADGLSISVSDQEVFLYGELASEEMADRVLEIVDQGRESRRVNTEQLSYPGKLQAAD